jgi:CheY-like chemotaxis protein
VVSICVFQAGTTNNVIPQTATLKGTIRSLTDAVRDQLETRDIPVIVITGLSGTRDRDASFAAGSDAYLSKPVSPRRLLEEVRRFLPS